MTSVLGRLTGVKIALGIAAGLLLSVLASAQPALASSPVWNVNTVAEPTNLPPGKTAKITLNLSNLGNATAEGAADPVVIADRLPNGLTAIAIRELEGNYKGTEGGSMTCTLSSVSCEFTGAVVPFGLMEVEVEVEVATSASSTLANETTVSGGGAASVTSTHSLHVSSTPAAFGVEALELVPTNEDGSRATQAGSHPFQLTTTLDLNTTIDPESGNRTTGGLVKDLRFGLPAGLVGNPTPIPQCTEQQFAARNEYSNLCPDDTVVGVALTSVSFETGGSNSDPFTVPVFNLTPGVGEPARFGYEILGFPVILDTSVRTGEDYGVTVSVNNITQTVEFFRSQVTFWGDPSDPRHNVSRGWNCLVAGVYGHGSCSPPANQGESPFLTLPTSCTGPSGMRSTVQADSWARPGDFTQGEYTLQEAGGGLLGMDGCNRLDFQPRISVAPDGPAGSTPTGLTVGLSVPQDASLNPAGLAESQVKDTTVTLPQGVQLNPAAADGLLSCSLEQIALSSAGGIGCSEASKVGTVEIKTPLLPDPLEGDVYLAAQNANPFGSLVALYIFAEDAKAGVVVKLAGKVAPDAVTGQLVSTFENTPQLPFEDLKLHFFGGSRAPLATPAVCGRYTTTTSIAPWSGNGPVEPSSSFDVTSGPNGSACASPLPFAPSLTAGTTNLQAGDFSPFTMTMSREDGQQNLQSIKLHMPPGLLGTLASVKLCGEPQADQGSCGPESEIGETTVSVGLGGDPFSVKGGKVFITGPYDGAPYGLSIVNPAKAGPFDLGEVIVRAKIEIDPITAALTITTDTTGPYKIPTILDGIPLQIKHVNVAIDRPGFTFNPTNCSPLAITGNLQSDQGKAFALSVPFQITNCAVLAFKPKLRAHTAGKTSRAKGASLSVKLTYPAGPFDANIARVKVDLPKQLPSRLTTLQKACPAATFEANPANCPSASIVGHATATTPVIPVPLTGPAYFVSHGGEAFPDLIIVLQGYGATVHLVGTTFINKAGITSSTFKQVPDVPVGTFELTLPQGKYSALAANGNLCSATKLAMPTSFVAQNGAVIHSSTPITPTGCAKHKAKKKAPKANARHNSRSGKKGK